MTESGRNPPRHGSRGGLYARDGTHAPVRISYDDDEITLLVLEHAELWVEQSLAELTLESTGGRGVLRTVGHGRHIRRNLIQFIPDEPGEELVQRREFVRVVTAERVVLRDQDEKVLAMTLTVDISGGGILIRVPASLQIGPEVYFDLHLGDDDVIYGTGRVIRSGRDDLRAIVFTEISHADRERLIRNIFNRQRMALAVTRGDTV